MMIGAQSVTEAGIAALPIDHVHLAKYTLGNRPLEIEVLQLFSGQAPETYAALETAGCAKSWHVAAHTLKGSARAVGAWAVATAAEAAERAGPTDPRREALLGELRGALEAARCYIEAMADAA